MSWDYIVVGAGSAGCALAYELVNCGKNVLVIEAGGADRSPFIKIPAGELRAAEKYDWGYYAQPDSSRNGIRQRWLRGRVLGGSSSINGMIYVRGAADDFHRWSGACGGAGGWSPGEINSIFCELEKSDQMNEMRGRSGPLHVRTVRQPHAVTRAFVESGLSLGHRFNEDYNSRDQDGISFIQFSQRRGFRCSSADAFLRPLIGRSNLKLLLNSSVQRIDVVNGRAVGVTFRHRGKQRREMASGIILCAGAINSPKLLMLSGIGHAKELEHHGIGVVVDSPGVGDSLQDHPLIYLAYRMKVPTHNPTEGLLQKVSIAAQYLRSGEGPIANPFEAIAFLKSTKGQKSPDLQIFFSAVGVFRLLNGSFKTAPYPSITVAVANSYPISTGSVKLRSKNSLEPPIIEYELLGSQPDVDTLARGVQAVREIMRAEPISGLVEAEILPGGHVGDQASLNEFIRGSTSICYHSIGTCRMGAGPQAVVAPDLRVNGVKDLWIADASIIPSPISGNMNASCMMIGAKLGKHLSEIR
jgi:choline dehydrogenase